MCLTCGKFTKNLTITLEDLDKGYILRDTKGDLMTDDKIISLFNSHKEYLRELLSSQKINLKLN